MLLQTRDFVFLIITRWVFEQFRFAYQITYTLRLHLKVRNFNCSTNVILERGM